MTTLIDEAPATPATSTPSLQANRPDAEDHGSAATKAQSVGRRLLERFALIVLGLYHLPLFLNNYPSLGGGGFDGDGLAIRWGHVFTPVGIWVARHVFGMTGPMDAASNGDNGDYGEEYGRLLVSAVVALVGAVCWTVADRRKPGGRWVEPTFRTMLRYFIALGLVSYGVAKILPMQFGPLTALDLEGRVGDLPPAALLWQFMRYSQPYAFFGGAMELVAVALLCFRRTATLGALVCLGVMTNVALLNYSYDVVVKLYATMIVISAAVLVLYDTPRLLAMFVRNARVAPAPLAGPQDRLSAPLRWTIKVALVGSAVLSSAMAMAPIIATRDAPAPIDGGWVVTSFTRDGQALESTGDPVRWRRFIATGQTIAIRFESDSILYCGGTAAAAPESLTLVCGPNRGGTLRWTRTGNILQLEGTFDGARVAASGRHLERSDYRLWRNRFHMFSDR